MKNILLPTDFSDNSMHAINHALQLFSEEMCQFYLLHSYAPMVDNMDSLQISGTQFDVEGAAKKASQERLSSFLDKIEKSFKNSHHTFDSISTSNSLTHEVKDLVEKKYIDYVVMGTRGATGSKEVLFGSNTVHVFKNATCPVLAIPENAEYKTLQDILFTTDYEIAYQDKNLQPLLGIVKQHNAKIHVLHVSFGNELTAEQKQHQSVLKTYLEKTTPVFHDVRNEEVSSAIVGFQKQTPVDMLAMINNKHSFFENLFFKSKINHIGFHIQIPFLVIPS